MNFIDINTLDISTNLDVLKRDTQRHVMLLYQHKGEFYADNDRIGNVNTVNAHERFSKIIQIARRDNVDIVLSPEYSCPLTVVLQIIEDSNYQPGEQKIWALGGESINLGELHALDNCNADNVLVHFEETVWETNKSYLDPLFYVFRGIHNGSQKLIILIQFKTRHMGVWTGDLERNNLIVGNNIYIIKNDNASVRLMSFICSEAMNARDDLTQDVRNQIQWDDMPFLILHPQMNPDPSHSNFVDFRKFILNSEKKEIISLNWGVETIYNGNNWYSERGSTARSGIFFRTDELNYNENRIVGNHKKGLYFLHINRNKFVYFFNGIPEAFRIENPAVHIIEGEATQRRREGPEVTAIYSFDATPNLIELLAIDDKHIDFFIQRGIANRFLLNPVNSIIDKEILINISTGKIKEKHGNKWCDIIHLDSFNLRESDECNCRMTYIEDTYELSETVRSLNFMNLNELDQGIIPNKSNYPISIEELKYQDISLSYSRDASTFAYKYNVIDENGETKKATICNLGNVSIDQVRSVYDKLQKLFDVENEGKRRIVVFYKMGANIMAKYDENAGSITMPSVDSSSIV